MVLAFIKCLSVTRSSIHSYKCVDSMIIEHLAIARQWRACEPSTIILTICMHGIIPCDLSIMNLDTLISLEWVQQTKSEAWCLDRSLQILQMIAWKEYLIFSQEAAPCIWHRFSGTLKHCTTYLGLISNTAVMACSKVLHSRLTSPYCLSPRAQHTGISIHSLNFLYPESSEHQIHCRCLCWSPQR